MSVWVREAVTIPLMGGAYLRGDFGFVGQPGLFTVLCVHGFGSHRGGEKVQAIEQECQRIGWTFASFDFRGHGQSSGTMTDLRGSGLLSDLSAIQTWLFGRGVRKLYLFGSSMGGWASSWFANRHPEIVPAVVLLAPAFQFLHARWSRLTVEQQEEWKRTGKMRFTTDWVDAELSYDLVAEREQFPVETLFREWKTPTLIFHGMNDDVVRPASSIHFIEQVQYQLVELRLIRDGDHRLTAHKQEIARETLRFYQRAELL